MSFSQRGCFGSGPAVREWAKMLWEAVKGEVNLEEARGSIYKGGPMETDVDEGLRGVKINSSDVITTSAEGDVNCDKVILPAARLERKFGEGFGETNSDEPVIFPCPNNPASPFPPHNMSFLSLAPVRLLNSSGLTALNDELWSIVYLY